MQENFSSKKDEKMTGSEGKEAPQFIKQFSRENSEEERDSVAAAIRERRRERDAWRVEQNSRMEGKENVKAELESLNEQIKKYNSDNFLNKIKDYFAYRNVKAQLAEKSGELTTAEGSVGQWESEKPEFEEVNTLLKNFYDGEKEKWAKADYSREDLKKQFSEEHLVGLSVDDYAILMKRFPSEMLTHVTRQGIRDHASSFWHTAGLGDFSNGFKEMLSDGKLRSSLGIALQEHTKEEIVAKFLHLDQAKSRDDALARYKNKFEHNIATGEAFADHSSVHVASENVMDAMYGSERGNEIFVAYPSAYVASQLNYGGKGTLADREADQHNDKWIYTKDHEGMPLDAGLVFIPEDAKVDPKTGSRYKMSESGEPIVPKQRTEEILAARFDKQGFVQAFVQNLSPKLYRTPIQDRAPLAEAAFTEFGITDPEAKKALLDPNLLEKIADAWGKNNEKEEYSKLLAEYFHENSENPYELAENTVSSREYWEKHFQENPDQRPSKIVYYSGGDPSRALNEWREKNGIVKQTKDPTYGFAEHHVADNSAEANMGKDRFASLARKVIDDRFPNVLSDKEPQ